MSRLILVRHGETVWHAENRYAGRTDVALTDKGMAQAARLARWATGAQLSAVWASPLSRAQLTARPAAEALGLQVQTEARLIEVDFGRGEGLTDAEMKAAFPEERAAFLRDPAANPLPGSEDPAVAAERGVAALYAIAEATAGGRALVVAHNTLFRLVLCKLLGIPLGRYRTTFPQLANGTVTEIGITDAGVSLLSFNAPLGGEKAGGEEV
jgi:broad specificity phosphatase PhoE